MASLLMLCGSIGDRLGRQRMFIAGLAVFSARGRCCPAWPRASGSWSRPAILQAVGGAMLNPVAVSIITNTFTDPARAGAGSRRSRKRVRRLPGPWPDRGRRAGVLDRVAVDLPGQRSPRHRRDRVGAALHPESGHRGRGASIRSARCWSRSCSRRSPTASSRARAKDGLRPPILGCFARPARRSSVCSSTSPADSNP